MMNIGPAAKETALQLLMLIILKVIAPCLPKLELCGGRVCRPWEVFCDGAGDVSVFSFLCLSSGG